MVDRLRERTSERTRRMFVAMDVQHAKDLAARGDLAAAREAWIKTNLLHPDSFEAHMGLGIFYECAGEWDGAARQYERAIESYPGAARVDLYAPQPGALAEAHARLGRAAEKLGDADAARTAFDQATTIRATRLPREEKNALDSPKSWTDFLTRLDRNCPPGTGTTSSPRAAKGPNAAATAR